MLTKGVAHGVTVSLCVLIRNCISRS